jgi:hypothetical protein
MVVSSISALLGRKREVHFYPDHGCHPQCDPIHRLARFPNATLAVTLFAVHYKNSVK